jgi:arabinofuranan 3-O-arabinosyltransferase
MRSPESVWRIRYAAACAVLTAFVFNCDSGLVAPDTKLDLPVNPVAFLSRALRMWDPQGFAGQVQNQAYGYLFPTGPFFALGKAAHLPMWAVQRLWWSALLCIAFLGVVALARRLEIGTPASRMIAGLAFALSPHVLTVLGPLSAEALPMCLAPWVLVPLVTGANGGSPRRAAMRSGIAVLCMGAINAALVLAALVPAALWLLTRRPDARTRRLSGAWVLAVGLATAWWVVPLALFGNFSASFLGHIESSATSTSTVNLVESLRGTSDWVAYLPSSGWHAGWLLLTAPAVIINTVVVVALGLAGLALRTAPHRNWLVACLLTGAVLICIAYVGTVDGLVANSARTLLDGALAPLRNVHKFDVVLRLPLVLGLAHLGGQLSWGSRPSEQRISRMLVLVLAAGAVAGTATPLFALRLAPAATFSAVPDYWRQTADWLGSEHATGRSLLLPGTRFPQYRWGSTGDEPMQPLAESAWDVRNAVPLSSAGHVRLLDAVDAQLATGQPSVGLSAYLARSGVQFVVVRNDLDLATADAARPVRVHEALQGSPGLSLVRSFGPLVGGDAVVGGTLDQHLQLPYRAVEVWAVAGPGERRVEAVATSGVVQVSGGPESLLTQSDGGLPAERPAVLTGDVTGGFSPGQTVLTDTLRRREANYGAGALDTSATLTLDEPRRMASSDRDYLPFPGDDHQSFARLIGAKAISASSSASDPDAFGGSVHAEQPYAAFDGDPQTAWRSNSIRAGVGEWLQIDFDTARLVDDTTVLLAAGSTDGRIQVRTDRGTATTDVSGAAPIPLRLPPGSTRSLRLTFVAATGHPGRFGQVGVAELTIPHLHVARTIVMPRDLAPGTALQEVDMSVPADARNGCTLVATRPLCAAGVARVGEESTGLDRSFTLPAGGSYTPALTAMPRAGPKLDALLRSVELPSITASASSQGVADPLAGPQTAVDVDLGTGWIASVDDPNPSLTLRWAKKQTVSSLTIVVDPLLAATAPDTVTISSPSGTRVAKIGPGGRVEFEQLRTDRITMALTSSIGLQLNYDPIAHALTRLGLGVSEVAVNGITSTARSATDGRTVALPCGAGPDVVIDGVDRRTSVTTTVATLRELRPVPLVVCGKPTMNLSAGDHRLRAVSTATWRPSSVVLTDTRAAAAAATVPIAVHKWSSTDRTVAVGARPSPTLVVVHENANAGWRATLGGHRLTSVTVDGWAQGYLLPAGAAGEVHLRYWPDAPYRAALIVGMLLVLVLLAGVVLRPRRERPLGPSGAWRGRAGLAVLALAAVLLTGGAIGALAWLLVAAIALGADRGRRRIPALRHLIPGLAAGCYLSAGVVLAARHWGQVDYAGGSAIFQFLCLCALVATAWGSPRAFSAERGAAAASPGGAENSPAVRPVGT